MKYIRIKSQGIIDEKAFTLVGASSKRGDGSKIGFFGSGLKYSIAYLLRNNIPFKVFAGEKEFIFSKEPEKFRDKSFDVIFVNGVKTSLTTEMGIDWEAWFIIREIYCNALDEGESEIRVINPDSETGNKVVPITGSTVFYIEAEPFKDVVDNWGDYFSEGRGDLVTEHNGTKFYRAKEQQSITYRKGIRCAESESVSIFHYDADWIRINESRVIANEFNFKYELAERLVRCNDLDIITQVFARINDAWEKELYWDLKSSYLSDAWLEAVNGRTLVPTETGGFWLDIIKEDMNKYLILPNNLCNALKERFVNLIRLIGEGSDGQGGSQYRKIECTDRMNNMLIRAVDFLNKANYPIKYPIEVVRFSKESQLGQAKGETIFIGDKVFDKGQKQLISTLMEENEHLVSGYGDETRAFETHIFERWITSMENFTKEYL